jgi:opacity protein-like surface antigen
MRASLRSGVGVLLAAVVAGVCAANAADLSAPAPVYKAPVYKAPVISDWAGFYIGVDAGYGFGHTLFPSPGDVTNPKGGVFGGYAGYNWQFGSWVAGVEADGSGTTLNAEDVNGTAQKTPILASVRARLGYTVLPNLLVYGTAGGAYGRTTLETTPFFTALGFGTANTDHPGWAAGAGVEYKVWGNFIARAEYLHYDLSSAPFSFPNAGVLGYGAETVDIVRGGLSYKF